jgi:hypothetical protein
MAAFGRTSAGFHWCGNATLKGPLSGVICIFRTTMRCISSYLASVEVSGGDAWSRSRSRCHTLLPDLVDMWYIQVVVK